MCVWKITLLREMLQLCYKTGKVIDFYIMLVYDSTVTYETYGLKYYEISRNVTVMLQMRENP